MQAGILNYWVLTKISTWGTRHGRTFGSQFLIVSWMYYQSHICETWLRMVLREVFRCRPVVRVRGLVWVLLWVVQAEVVAP